MILQFVGIGVIKKLGEIVNKIEQSNKLMIIKSKFNFFIHNQIFIQVVKEEENSNH